MLGDVLIKVFQCEAITHEAKTVRTNTCTAAEQTYARAVVVATNADVLDARHLNDVLNVVGDVGCEGVARGDEERAHEGDHGDAACTKWGMHASILSITIT